MSKLIVITDPYPRTLDLIFTKKKFKELKKIPKNEIPNFLFKAIAMFDDRVKILVQDLGKFYDTDMVYVNNMTKVIPRPAKQAIIEGAHSLIANGSVRIR